MILFMLFTRIFSFIIPMSSYFTHFVGLTTNCCAFIKLPWRCCHITLFGLLHLAINIIIFIYIFLVYYFSNLIVCWHRCNFLLGRIVVTCWFNSITELAINIQSNVFFTFSWTINLQSTSSLLFTTTYSI